MNVKKFLVYAITAFVIIISSVSISYGSERDEVKMDIRDKGLETLDTNNISFNEILNTLTEYRKSLLSNPLPDYSEYTKHHPGETDITKEEIRALKESAFSNDAFVSPDGAREDVRLLFKVFKYCYGAYYYFGEEKFNTAEEKILNKIDNIESEGRDELHPFEVPRLITDELKFMLDNHTSINNSKVSHLVDYYYCDVYFEHDESGYYLEEDGKRWEYIPANTDRIVVQPCLTADGKIKYSPVQLTTSKYYKETTDILLKSGNEKKEIQVTWIRSKPYSGQTWADADYKFIQEEGISYISLRSFDPKYKDIFSQMLKDAKKVKESKLIIFDLRSNEGGNEEFLYDWIKTITGTKPEVRRLFAPYESAFSDFEPPAVGNEYYRLQKSNGKMGKNSIPVIILTDEYQGSAGEGTVELLNHMENTIVIGSNTRGCHLTGTPCEGVLPNSRIRICIGTNLDLSDIRKNIDGIGLQPDIWCNPENAIPTVLKMLNEYGIADAESLRNLGRRIQDK